MDDLAATLGVLRLVDGHCHTVVRDPVDDDAFAMWCTEASMPAPAGMSYLDGQLGFAVRRWCAPVLDLPANAAMPLYLARRRELGAPEVTRRLLAAAGLRTLLVDTGLRAAGLLEPAALAGLAATAGVGVAEVVRLEHLAQRIAPACTAAGFGAAFRDALSGAVAGAVAVKSVAAYRCGLDLDPGRPAPAEVAAAAGGWLRECEAGRPRLTDPVLLRHLLWCAVDTGRPIQVHTGFGDRDLRLNRSDPALLQPFCAAVEPTGVPLVLLHCYPYHRQAGWLAQVYPNVYVDVGLAITHLGARSGAVLAEFLELAPFGKLLYSSDTYGLPELYQVGAAQFRYEMSRLLTGWVTEGAFAPGDAHRVANLIGARNAGRVYGLGG